MLLAVALSIIEHLPEVERLTPAQENAYKGHRHGILNQIWYNLSTYKNKRHRRQIMALWLDPDDYEFYSEGQLGFGLSPVENYRKDLSLVRICGVAIE